MKEEELEKHEKKMARIEKKVGEPSRRRAGTYDFDLQRQRCKFLQRYG
jgi:hypothetical protein